MDPSAVSATVVAPIRATVVSIDVAPGDVVHRGQRLIVLESMKMEHVVGGDDERRGHDDRGRRRADRSIPGSDFSPREEWTCADQTLLREAVPENRLRAYDIRGLIDTLADTGSVLELRPQIRCRNRHLARARRGPPARTRREQPDAPRWRDRH